MSKGVAAAILFMVAVVVTADPFCCADGCTNGQQHAITAPTCCSLCMSSVTVPTTPTLSRVVAVQRFVNDVLPRSVFPPTRRIEHPPRLA